MDYNQQCLYRPIKRFTFMGVSLADSINTETNKSDKFLGDKFFVSIDKDFQSSPIENLWYKHESN